MSRLTLSEQVNAQASRIAELTAELHDAKEIIAECRSTVAVERAEISRLRQGQEALEKLKEELARLTKELETSKSSYAYRDRAADKAEADVEQAHAVLDSVEGAPSREYERRDGYGSHQRNIATRLAGAFLAIARKG